MTYKIKYYIFYSYLEYGKCANCNEYNTYKAWCHSCDPDIATRWTSRSRDIDDCVKKLQIRIVAYDEAIEWIPYDRLSNVKKIGEGGFSTVYSATWLDGIRKIDGNDFNYLRVREPSSLVALKTLSSSLNEFDNHITCGLYGSKLKTYGLTQNNLFQIHRAGYTHADFHSGNILQDESISKNMQSYIADLGLSKKGNDNDSVIYGVMPYVSPEVFSCSPHPKFTKAADIYGFGVIMSEMSTGQRPFDGYEFDTDLAIKIWKGLRPEFAPGTPDCYIEFAKQCMDSDPGKRPDAYNVHNKLKNGMKS
ncbi:kinase-like domain-containing protein [Gigaspora rosea]|uniref:Kinase-like domain-containing protein n=1 Tax=Gigaspora rosea TaxID=44941 RepID=A0A397UN11_9GLOM|nr:kinase-like domain-containing protein [Gigaspora rosea]